MSGLDAPPVRAAAGRERSEAVSDVDNADVEGEAHPANADMASSIHVPVTILFITSRTRRAEVCCAGSCKVVVKALQNRQARGCLGWTGAPPSAFHQRCSRPRAERVRCNPSLISPPYCPDGPLSVRPALSGGTPCPAEAPRRAGLSHRRAFRPHSALRPAAVEGRGAGHHGRAGLRHRLTRSSAAPSSSAS